MMRRGILLRSSPLVYAQHLLLETSPECFEIGTTKGWRRIIYVKIFVSILCHDGTDSQGTILQLLQHVNCHRSFPMVYARPSLQETRSPFFKIGAFRAETEERKPMLTSLKIVHVCQQCGISLRAKRLFIHACFFMKLAFIFYYIPCQTIWVDWTSRWHNPMLQF